MNNSIGNHILGTTPDTVVVFTFLTVTSIIFSVSKRIKFYIPHKLILVVLSSSVAAIFVYTDTHMFTFSNDLNMWNLLQMVLPLMIIKWTYDLDIYLFMKAIPMIILLSTVGLIIYTLIMGSVLVLTGKDVIGFKSLLVFGLAIAATDDLEINQFMNKFDQLKMLTVIMQGETLIGIAVSWPFLIATLGFVDGIFDEWYHFFVYFIRVFGGGIILGVVIGFIMSIFVSHQFKNPETYTIFILIVTYGNYFLCEHILFVSGALSTFIIMFYVVRERPRLQSEIDALILGIWENLYYIFENFTYTIVISLLFIHCAKNVKKIEWLGYLITYLCSLMARFVTVVVLYPILSIMGKRDFNLKHALSLFWLTKKGIIQIIFFLATFHSKKSHEVAVRCMDHVLALVVLNLIVNGLTSKKYLAMFGLTSYTREKKINMRMCVNYIENKRFQFLTSMKLSRFLSDVYWAKAEKHIKILDGNEDMSLNKEGYYDFMSNKQTFCDDCRKDIIIQPTKREITLMTEEAKMRILKSLRVSFIRQVEIGLLTEDGLQTLLIFIDKAMNSSSLTLKIDDLLQVFTKQTTLHKLKGVLQAFTKITVIRLPRKKFRRFCHIVTQNRVYGVVIYIFGILSFVEFCFSVIYHTKYVFYYEMALLGVFTLDYIMKVLALSQIYIKEGFIKYFDNYWYKLDFIMLIFNYAKFILDIFLLLLTEDLEDIYVHEVWALSSTFNVFKVLRLLKTVAILHHSKFLFINLIDKKIDYKLARGCDIGMALCYSYDEVMHYIPSIISQESIQNEIKDMIMVDKEKVEFELQKVQINSPSIAVRVKTKQAIRATMKNIKLSILTLKKSGYIDEYEFRKLNEAQYTCYLKSLNTKIKRRSEESIFHDVPWLDEHQELREFLYANSIYKVFRRGSIIIDLDFEPTGFYILLEGILSSSFVPSDSVHRDGCLPIRDYISSDVFHEPSEFFLIQGNVVGELSIMTGRQSQSIIRCETDCKFFFVDKRLLTSAGTLLFQNNIQGYYNSIWKYISYTLVQLILWSSPVYKFYTNDEIQEVLRKSFVPNLKGEETFYGCELIEDIVLIEGKVEDMNTFDFYVAPCYLPRFAQNLYLINNNINVVILLIIPFNGQNADEIMTRNFKKREIFLGASTRFLRSKKRSGIRK